MEMCNCISNTFKVRQNFMVMEVRRVGPLRGQEGASRDTSHVLYLLLGSVCTGVHIYKYLPRLQARYVHFIVRKYFRVGLEGTTPNRGLVVKPNQLLPGLDFRPIRNGNRSLVCP